MAGCLHHEYIEKKLNVNPTPKNQLPYHRSSQMIFLSPAAQRDVPSARRFLPNSQHVIPLLWPRWSWPAFRLATRPWLGSGPGMRSNWHSGRDIVCHDSCVT
jgi:hypothetical protein